MYLIKRLFSSFLERLVNKHQKYRAASAEIGSIPTVEFNPALITDVVKCDLRTNMEKLPELNSISNFGNLYTKVLSSIQHGRDLQALCKALLEVGIPKTRAEEIARHLANNATSIINRERQKSLGITQAIWMYANAPCMVNPRKPTKEDLRRDAAHRKANGKCFNIEKGMYLNGKWTWPGREPGCKCSSRSVLPW